MRKKKLLWLLILPLVAVSCWSEKDFENIAIEPFTQSWVFPVVNSQITFKEIVERSDGNTVVETDPNDPDYPTLYFMSTRDTIDIGYASDEFNLTGEEYLYSFELPQGALYQGFGSYQTQQTFEQTFEIAPSQLVKFLDFYDGEMHLRIYNRFGHRIEGELEIESLMSYDEANEIWVKYKRPFDLTAGSSVEPERDLRGWRLDLFKQSTNTYNNFRIKLNFTIFENTQSSNYGGGLDVRIEFINPVFDLLVGRFNKEFTLPNQTFKMSVFSSTTFAEQYFANPTLSLYFDNTYGIPMTMKFNHFRATNYSGQIIDVVNNGVAAEEGDLIVSNGGLNHINYVESLDDVQSAKTELTLTAEKSNIDEVFRIAPNKVSFGADIKIGDGSNNDYFIRRSSKLNVITDIHIPLDGYAITHLIADTVSGIPWPNIEETVPMIGDDFLVSLKFKVTNELPLNLRFKVIFVDENFDEVCTLFESDDVDPEDQTLPIAHSAVINPTTGVAIVPTVSYLTLQISPEKYREIQESTYMLMYYRLYTGGNEPEQSIKVLSSNTIRIQTSLQVTANIKPEL